MKKIILIFGIFFCNYYTFAQLETISIEIPRDNYNNIIIIDSDKDTILLTKENDERLLQTNTSYKIVNGSGRQKDYKGERERNKQYLLNSMGDTLLTLRESQKTIEFKDSICLFMKRTKNGWKYIDAYDTTVCELELFWNNSFWRYELKYFKSNQYIEDLKKVNMLNLVRLAYNRSKCNCEKSSDDDDFWFIMWLIQL